MSQFRSVAVEKAGLYAVGAMVISGSDDARRSFERHTTELRGAAEGLFGKSSEALQSRADIWATVGAALAAAAGEYGSALHAAAWRYDTIDRENSLVVQSALHRPDESTARSDLRL